MMGDPSEEETDTFDERQHVFHLDLEQRGRSHQRHEREGVDPSLSPITPTSLSRSRSGSRSARSPRKSLADLGVAPIDSAKRLLGLAVEYPSYIDDVDLSGKEIKEFPIIISRLPHLHKLNLHSNQLTLIPEDVKCKSLLDLDLSFNELFTVSPDLVLNFPNLHRLNLRGNALDFGEIEPLGSLVHLRFLDLGFCYLHSIPSSFTHLAHLHEFLLTNNELREFPVAVLSLRSLNVLNLDFNKIPEIPLELAELKHLKLLTMHGNPIASFPEVVRLALRKAEIEISIPQKNLVALRQLGISHILSVLDSDLPSTFDILIGMHISVVDDEGENLLSHFPDAFDFIHGAIEGGGRVLVHCAAGVSRSASVVISYLMKLKHIRAAEAIDMVKQVRPFINPNPGFLRQLKQYEKALSILEDSHHGNKKLGDSGGKKGILSPRRDSHAHQV